MNDARHQGAGCSKLGVEAEGNSPAEFAAYVKAEIAKWKKVIEDAEDSENLTSCIRQRMP